MTVATMIVLLLLVVGAVAFAVRRSELQGAAAALRLLAVLLAVAAAAVLFRPIWEDSGTFAFWGLGLPVLVALVPLLTAGSRFGVAVTAVAAALLLGWSVLAALGFGLLFLPAALAETAAAGTQRRPSFTSPGTAP